MGNGWVVSLEKTPFFVRPHPRGQCWAFGPDDLARIYDQRDTKMVFVTPMQLAALYRQAKDKGLVK